MQEGRAGLPDSAVKSERYERGESSMMKKQKIMLYRIIAAAVIYVPLFVLEHMGKLEFKSEIPVQFLLFMIPYLIVDGTSFTGLCAISVMVRYLMRTF